MLPRNPAIALLVVASSMMAACGPKSFENENDALRARVMELERTVEDLQTRTAELTAELASATTSDEETTPDARLATPRPARIAIDRLSHAVDDDDDSRADRLVIYLEARDGRDRAIQLTGTLTVVSTLIFTDADVITIGRIQLPPLELRDAHRSGFMGTHYTIELAIDPPAGAPFSSCEVNAVFIDGSTGQRLDAHRTIPLDRLRTP